MHQFTSDGATMAYTTLGEAPKVLLILHGWGSRSDVMVSIAKALQHERKCVLVDFPGFGASPQPPKAWAVQDYSNLIADFVQQNYPNQKVDIIAHSFGARVMLKLLSNKKTASLFDKVLFTGGAGMKPKRSLKFYFKKYLAKTLKAPFTILPKGLEEKALAWLRTTAIWKSLGSADYQQLSGVMRETFVKTVSEYLDGCLPLISHDILLLWGENDEATPIYQARRMEANLENGALVIIKNAGHYAFLDQPVEFNAIAKAFFSEQ